VKTVDASDEPTRGKPLPLPKKSPFNFQLLRRFSLCVASHAPLSCVVDMDAAHMSLERSCADAAQPVNGCRPKLVFLVGSEVR
jgi:hypothetical protein